jgi:thiol:disulfide interchange protein
MKLTNILICVIMVLNVAIFFSLLNSSQEPVSVAPWQPPIAAPIESRPITPVTPTVPTTYEEAITQSRELKKPLFIFFHANWCKWCEKMEKETLTNPEVKKALEKYVFFSVDYDKNKEIVARYGDGRMPMYLIDNNGHVKKREGFQTVPQFLNWINGTPAATAVEKPKRRLFSNLRG